MGFQKFIFALLLLVIGGSFANGSAKGDSHPALTYSIYPGPHFNPEARTIFFDPGGPIPLALAIHQKGLPFLFENKKGESIQLVRFDYLGTSRRTNLLGRNLTREDSARYFTSDQHAGAVAALIKKWKPKNYIFYGVSHGVQMFLRVLDKINRDSEILIKPSAAILDSGVGRQVTKNDLLYNFEKQRQHLCAKNKLGLPNGYSTSFIEALITVPNFKALSSCEQSEPFDNYLQKCGLQSIPDKNRQQFLCRNIRVFSKWESQWHDPGVVNYLMGEQWTTENIYNFAGCPSIDNIDYFSWTVGMACGSFDEEATAMLGLRVDSLGYCPDRPLDLSSYQIAPTAILGVQSSDDCTNFEGAMDDLMKKIETTEKYYFKVARAGGHGQFLRPQSGFQNCIEHSQAGPILDKIFEGKVNEAAQGLHRCYQDRKEMTATKNKS